MSIIYTDEQELLVSNVVKWFRSTIRKPYYSYTGGAGTGKTTVVKEIINQLGLHEGEYICAAYIGKAVLNLLRKGLPAKTIHSLIYQSVIIPEKYTDYRGEEKVKYSFEFILKENLPDSIRLIIIDEATMVNNAMSNDLLSFGIPIIFVGDMNQLPPVFGISSVMLNPDFALTKIMRQAEDNPIVYLANEVLNDRPLRIGKYGESNVVESYPLTDDILKYDQILCTVNQTRDSINKFCRKSLNKTTKLPQYGDKVICRQNNWDKEVNGIFLTNGLIGTITDINRSNASKGFITVSFQPDFMDEEFEDLKIDKQYILAAYDQKKKMGISRYEKFEYAYAITVHLSQGSEYDNVLFLDRFNRDYDYLKKLRYTAITRAKERIDIVLDETARWHGLDKFIR